MSTKENAKLKEQITALQSQVDHYKTQLTQSKKQKQQHIKMISEINKHAPSRKVPKLPPNKPPVPKEKVVPSPNKTKTTPDIIISVNRNHAASALQAKFANNDKPQAAQTGNNPTKKYEMMLKIGVDLSGVVIQMNKDRIDKKIITQFRKSHGGSIEDDHKQETDPIKLGLPIKLMLTPPKNTMKRMHWKPVKLTQIKDSIWNKVNQQFNNYESQHIELCFQLQKEKPMLSADALRHQIAHELKQTEEPQATISFVSAKRSQQVQNGLQSFNNMTHQELRSMILALDPQTIGIETLLNLIDIVPTPEEQLLAEQMSKEKDIQRFGVVERFFYSLCDIIELQSRLKKWIFKLEFDEKCQKLQKQIAIMQKTKVAVVESQHLKDIFGIILAFGNHMNYGNISTEQAYGFHLSDLLLLPQIKTYDNSMTFPMFLYSFIDKHYPYLLKVVDELSVIEEASEISMESMDKLYRELLNGMKDLRAMIHRYNAEYFEILAKDDAFVKEMKRFCDRASEEMKQLKHKYHLLLKYEEELIRYFAYEEDEESSNKMNMTKIFQDLCTFIQMLKNSKSKLDEIELQKKKKELLKKRKLSHRRRKSISDELNQNNLKQKSVSKVEPRAIGYDDIGTPLVNQQLNNISFSGALSNCSWKINVTTDYKQLYTIHDAKEQKMKPKTKSLPPAPRSRIKRSKSMMNRNKLDKNKQLPPRPNRVAPTLDISRALKPIKMQTSRARRNSAPATPASVQSNESGASLKMKESQNNKNIPSNRPKLMASRSNLTPCGDKSHANLDEDAFDGCDIDVIVMKDDHEKKQRTKAMPSKRLPSMPRKADC